MFAASLWYISHIVCEIYHIKAKTSSCGASHSDHRAARSGNNMQTSQAALAIFFTEINYSPAGLGNLLESFLTKYICV